MKTSRPENTPYKKHLLIAGPCSAESELQMVETALQLAELKSVHILRAGIWKPRTKPGQFEGSGITGLKWLKQAGQLTGLPVATEVAGSLHVEQALKYGVDILWIGARTSVSPFAVEEIADALKGTAATVFIKNPVNPDVLLWAGAVERFQKSGLENVGLVHRGFSSFGNSGFRNAPMWQIPIEMKRIFPQLPMICDPSHICGNRQSISGVAQRSLDLDYSGLMIETHYKPDEALTDSRQQITPAELGDLLQNLIWKNAGSVEEGFTTKLDFLREQINSIDEELLSLIANRMAIASKIGEIKRANSVTVFQPNRWREILDKALMNAGARGLSEDFIKAYMEALHMESIRVQNEINRKD